MSFPIEFEQPIAWGDMDAYGHVNNVLYLRYFETARVRYFEDFEGMALGDDGHIKPVVATISCQYKRPVVYPDVLKMRVGVRQLGNSSLTMICEMISPKVGLAAIAEAVIVLFDFKSQRPTRMPESLRQAIETIEARNDEPYNG